MGRQLFLHHYLPAHLASALVTGALVEFIFNVEPANLLDENAVVAGAVNGKGGAAAGKRKSAGGVSARMRPVRERLSSQSVMAAWAATAVIWAVVMWCFVFYAPLTYGKPGLSVEEVNRRKWLNYDLHFAK